MKVFLWCSFMFTSVTSLSVTSTVEQSCIVDTDQGRLDMSSIAKKDDAKFTFTTGLLGGDILLWNPCYDVTPSQCDSSDAGQFFIVSSQVTNDDPTCQTVAAKADSKFIIKDGNLALQYTGSSSLNDKYEGTIILTCNSTKSNPTFIARDDKDAKTFNGSVTGKALCLQALPASGGQGLSGGSVLLIIVLVVVVLYIVVGILICKFVRKAEGAEIFPNVRFWKDLPSLVKDGFMFVIRGCKPAAGGYENM